MNQNASESTQRPLFTAQRAHIPPTTGSHLFWTRTRTELQATILTHNECVTGIAAWHGALFTPRLTGLRCRFSLSHNYHTITIRFQFSIPSCSVAGHAAAGNRSHSQLSLRMGQLKGRREEVCGRMLPRSSG